MKEAIASVEVEAVAAVVEGLLEVALHLVDGTLRVFGSSTRSSEKRKLLGLRFFSSTFPS